MWITNRSLADQSQEMQGLPDFLQGVLYAPSSADLARNVLTKPMSRHRAWLLAPVLLSF